MVRLIGVFKLVKALTLGAVAIGLVANPSMQSLFWRLFGYVSDRKLHEAGAAGAIYALVFAVEGVGLLRVKRWAEWLTVIVTTSFVPLEIWKIAEHTTPPALVALAINVAVVVYLALRLARERAGDRRATARPPRRPATAPVRPA
ncbi:MAG: putative rane protein [bacterium]|nr:putative rane protein [bacterium]